MTVNVLTLSIFVHFNLIIIISKDGQLWEGVVFGHVPFDQIDKILEIPGEGANGTDIFWNFIPKF